MRNVVAHFNYSSKPKFNEQLSVARHEDVDESEVKHEDTDDESEARLLDTNQKRNATTTTDPRAKNKEQLL